MKLLLTIVTLLATFVFAWYKLDKNDYYRTDYRKSQLLEQRLPNSDSSNWSESVYQLYESRWFDTAFFFPGQKVSDITIAKNEPITGRLFSRHLDPEDVQEFLRFCNSPENFNWGETTWMVEDASIVFRFYRENTIVGKLYACLDDCYMVSAQPFTPRMKFGRLSDNGKLVVEKLVDKYFK